MFSWVDDVKNWHRWWSIRLSALLITLEAVQQVAPHWVEWLPPWTSAALATAIIVVRTVKQNLKL